MNAEGVLHLQREPSVATRKRRKGTKKDGGACTAWATEGGLCYFHAWISIKVCPALMAEM